MNNLIKQGADKMDKEIDVIQQLEPGWTFSENNILRKFQEVIGSKLTAASKWAGTTIFKSQREKLNFTRALEEDGRILVQNLGNKVDELLSNSQLFKELDKKGLGDRTKLMETIYDFINTGGMKGKYVDNVKTGKTEYVPLTKEEILDSRAFHKSNIPESLVPHMITIRNSIDELSDVMLKTPGRS